MEDDATDRRLHFHARHGNYEQAIGYGYFLNHVLHELNKASPRSAKDMLEQAALLMLNPENKNHLAADPYEQKKNNATFLHCLPKTLRRFQCLSKDSFSDKATAEKYFGSAADETYGLLAPVLLAHLYARKDFDPLALTPAEAAAIRTYLYSTKTPILGREDYRGYFAALEQNYGLKNDAIPSDFILKFDYPIPGGDEKLPLMTIADPQTFRYRLRSAMLGENAKRYDHLFDFRNFGDSRACRLVFLHPLCDAEYFEKLTRCLDPLLKTIDASPAQKPGPHTPPPEDKIDALATAYWLVAQSTPIVRGGGGYAMVVLEHLAHRLRAQGYDYDVPYTKEGMELWAQAATLPLEDRPGLQGFKSRFKDGRYFDRAARDEDAASFLLSRVQQDIPLAALAPDAAARAPGRPL